MSAAKIIMQLEKLIQLHGSLNSLAHDKTQAIKNNDIERLNALLNDELKLVKAIELAENSRREEVGMLLNSNGMLSTDTYHDLMAVLEEEEKKQLLSKREQLMTIIEDLKNRNKLNQQLIYQSLQYINISLDKLRPGQNVNLNYGKSPMDKQRSVNRNMFDSRA